MPPAPRQKSSFDDELHACQRELADFINHLFAIVANTGTARMAWSPRQYWRQVVQMHRVAVRGWPKAIPFCSPTQISSLNLIGRLRRGWRAGGEGGIRFRRLTDEEFEEVRMELEPLIDAETQKRREMRKQREDRRKKRQLRPIATRGIHRRAKGGIKSNEFIDESDVDELK